MKEVMPHREGSGDAPSPLACRFGSTRGGKSKWVDDVKQSGLTIGIVEDGKETIEWNE
jgi:hypothetical protein